MTETQNLIIIGAGQFGREVCTWTEQCIETGGPWAIKGFLDKQGDAFEGMDYQYRILGTVEDYAVQPEDVFVCAIGDPATKMTCCRTIESRNGRFATLIHPTAVIGRNITFGPGSIVGPLVQMSCDIEVGKHVFVGTHSNAGHDTKIGDYCQICGSCEINGNAVLDEGVFLGSHATVLPSARVGAWSCVGAGSVVLRRVAPRTKVFGVPAVEIGTID